MLKINFLSYEERNEKRRKLDKIHLFKIVFLFIFIGQKTLRRREKNNLRVLKFIGIFRFAKKCFSFLLQKKISIIFLVCCEDREISLFCKFVSSGWTRKDRGKVCTNLYIIYFIKNFCSKDFPVKFMFQDERKSFCENHKKVFKLRSFDWITLYKKKIL